MKMKPAPAKIELIAKTHATLDVALSALKGALEALTNTPTRNHPLDVGRIRLAEAIFWLAHSHAGMQRELDARRTMHVVREKRPAVAKRKKGTK